MSQKYSAPIAAADQSAIEEIQKFLPIFLVKAEQVRRQGRRASVKEITARLIYNELKETMAFIIYRVSSPQSVLKDDAHKLSYVISATEAVLQCTRDDFANTKIIAMLAAVELIEKIARSQYKYFKGHEAEAFPIIVQISKDALSGNFSENLKYFV